MSSPSFVLEKIGKVLDTLCAFSPEEKRAVLRGALAVVESDIQSAPLKVQVVPDPRGPQEAGPR